MKPRRVVLVGEFNPAIRAHQGIEASLALHRRNADPKLESAWLGTAGITPQSVAAVLRDATAIWAVPGTPYASTAGGLLAIRHARENRIPFLGTCGGFQHALMEFSENVLGRRAEHAEMNPAAVQPLLTRLSCPLVEVTGRVRATDAARFAALLGGPESTEGFHCNYGVNEPLAGIFENTALHFVAHDEAGQIRAFRVDGHPFFVGTLFQPERRALTGTLHPLVAAFFRAAGD